MKKIFVFCLLLSVSGTTFSQADTVTSHVMQADYLTKSKNQKTAAIVLLSGGGALAITGTFVGLSDLKYIFTPHQSHEGTAIGLIFTGSACMLGSIPLFISASHNKHKAMSITFNNDFVPGLQNNFIIKKPVQEVSLVFKF